MRETKSGKRLLPLVQLLPAVAVAGLVLVTVPRTAPVLAAVPERLAEAASEPAAEPAASSEEEAEGLTAVLPYADGVYTGSSRGFGGTVQVQVTMEGGHITDVQVLSAAHETSAFLRRAKRLLNTVLDAQTWEVDAVSEATYTSRGILGAIKNALTGEVVNNPLPPQTTPAAPPVEEEFTTPSAYRDGVYTASAEGFGGPITLQVTIADGVLADITVVSHDGETTSYFYKGRQVIATILETGTPEGVDAVSGATYSSTGILNAVKQALAKAANDACRARRTAVRRRHLLRHRFHRRRPGERGHYGEGRQRHRCAGAAHRDRRTHLYREGACCAGSLLLRQRAERFLRPGVHRR